MKKIIRLTEGDLIKLINRVINEGEDDELENLFEISKSDLELAKMIAGGLNVKLEDLYERKFGYLRGKEFNSCEEMDCGGNDFSFRINDFDCYFLPPKPFILFDIEFTEDIDYDISRPILKSILKKYSDGVIVSF